MNPIVAWFKNQKISTHTIAAVITSAIGAYYAVPQFHDLVNSVYSKLPSGVAAVVTTAVALYLHYRQSQKNGVN
jgi:hypothetical protein